MVFVSDVDDVAHWVEAGRCYERFALQATALGIRNAFINPPVEVGALRSQFAAWLDVGTKRPDLVVRFVYGPEMPKSLRRPVGEVLVAAHRLPVGRAAVAGTVGFIVYHLLFVIFNR